MWIILAQTTRKWLNAFWPWAQISSSCITPMYLQGIEITPCGKICCFNLGNFLYDWQEGDVAVSTMLREQNEGGVFRFVLDRDGVAQLVVLPTWIDTTAACGGRPANVGAPFSSGW